MNDSSATSRGTATSISRSSRSRGLARAAPDRRAVPRRRSSKLTLEGVEYDLSNLFGTEGTPAASHASLVDRDDNSSSSSSSHLNQDSEDDDDDDDYKSCRSRGTMRRDRSNASSVYSNYDHFDSNNCEMVFDKRGLGGSTQRRESPYRFGMSAMRTLMTSFRGIPELQDSFRLSKTGQVLAVDMEGPGTLLGDKKEEEEADEKEGIELLPARCSASANNGAEHFSLEDNLEGSKKGVQKDSQPSQLHAPPKTEVQEKTILAKPPQIETRELTNNTDTTVPYEESDDFDNSMSDLVYDDATGTYIYNDPLAQSEYHEALTSEEFLVESDDSNDGSQPEEDPPSPRYSLDDMTASVALEALSTHNNSATGGGRQHDILDDYDDEEHEMEISPGVYVPFRGAKETWHAVATRTTHELDCFDCSMDLVCINDCEYAVCPDCRVVNPVFSDNPVGKPFGVGMGFRKEWVVQKEQQLQLQREKEDSEAAAREETRKEMTMARSCGALQQQDDRQPANQEHVSRPKLMPQKSTPKIEEPTNFVTGMGGRVGTGRRRLSGGPRRGLRRGPSS